MRDIAKRFKDPDDLLRIVVVREMWPTGFDVPSLHTLYIDRPMKDHGLLQAISRVNRVFRDKPGGLVVDYIGIGDDLRAALPAYRAEDVEHVTIPRDSLVAKLREKHEVLCDLLHGVPFRERHTMSSTEAATMFGMVVQNILADEEITERYLNEHLGFSKLYALVSPDAAAVQIKDDAEFFSDVAKAARNSSRRPRMTPAPRPSRPSNSSSPRAWRPARSLTCLRSPTRTGPKSRCSPTSSSTASARASEIPTSK